MTVIVSSPRFNTNKRRKSGDCTANTGHLPTGIGTSVVKDSASIGVATPSPWACGARLHSTPVGLVVFWLIAYWRWPDPDGEPAMYTGVLAGASGIASLKACGLPEKVSIRLPFRSPIQSPIFGTYRLIGCARAGSVEVDSFFCCNVVVIGKFVIV